MNTIFLAKDILNKGKTTAGLLYVKDWLTGKYACLSDWESFRKDFFCARSTFFPIWYTLEKISSHHGCFSTFYKI